MPGNHWTWALQYSFPADLVDMGPWHVWAVVRVEPRAASGPGIQLGIYDWSGGPRVSVTKAIEELRGKAWHTVDLGVHDLTSGCYLWAAPRNNPQQVEAVYVDRFFFVRETPK